MLTNPAHPGEPAERGATEQAARAAGLEIRVYEVRGVADFHPAFAAIEADGCDCLLAFPDTLTLAQRGAIADFAQRARLPAIFGWSVFAEHGALLTYGPNLHVSFASLAGFVDRILKGARPADLPVEQPTSLELVINLATAEALGIQIPPSLLARADEVIE